MLDLESIKTLKGELQKKRDRRSELKAILSIIQGGTQKKFTLQAGDHKIDLCGDMDRSYTFNMKPCFDMVKLGLIKGLDKQIDQIDNEIQVLKDAIIVELKANIARLS